MAELESSQNLPDEISFSTLELEVRAPCTWIEGQGRLDSCSLGARASRLSAPSSPNNFLDAMLQRDPLSNSFPKRPARWLRSLSIGLGAIGLALLPASCDGDDDDGGGGGVNTNLSALTLTAGALAPAFNPNTTSYTVTAGSAVTSTMVTATTASPTLSTLTINGANAMSGVAFGPIALNTGANPITIVVSNSGLMKTYTVTVTRQALSNQLSDLVVSAGTLAPPFASATTSYTVLAPTGTTSTTVTATLADLSSTMTINGLAAMSGVASAPIALNPGPNPIPIEVTATDATMTTYTVTVNVPLTSTLAQQAYIKASNTAIMDNFGSALALSGDTLAAGAPSEDSNATGINGSQLDNSAAESGAVYVFTRTAGVWSQQAYIKASNTEASDGFGDALDIDGDTLVVGAPNEDSNATGVGGDEADNSALESGAVYVFTRTAGVWSQEAYIKASNTQADYLFGTSVSISGDWLVVGSPGEASNATGVNGDETDTSAPDAGAAYVFQRVAGVWTQIAYIKASNTETLDQFGIEVSISGDLLAVSSEDESSDATGINGAEDNNNAPDSGAVYVYSAVALVWSQEAYIKASNSEAGDNFGESVSLSGSTLAVGSDEEDSSATGVNGDEADNSASSAGAAYVFQRTAGVWSQEAYIKASNTEASDSFGISIDVDGDKLIVGSCAEASNATGINGDQSNNSASAAGAANFFDRIGGVWLQTSYVKASNTGSQDEFGDPVTIDGTTLAVGAALEDSSATGIGGNQADNSAPESGAAYVFVE